MAIEFDDSEYQRSHGKAPRGRGGWGFRFRRDGELVADPAQDAGWGELGFVWWANAALGGATTFGEAKRWARAKAVELGAETVEVCS